MKYKRIIERCSTMYPMFSEKQESIGMSKRRALEFLDKYSIRSDNEIQSIKLLQSRIFHIPTDGLPHEVFHTGYSLKTVLSGCLFNKPDFSIFVEILHLVEERCFYIIQNDYNGKLEQPLILKFPVDLSWEEMNSGGMLSDYLLRMPYEQYFLFGGSGVWGRFTDNEFDCPCDVYGFSGIAEEKINHIFHEEVDYSNDFYKYLPPVYRESLYGLPDESAA